MKLTLEQFIEKAKKVHGNRYDYSKTEYINYSTKLCIICKEHGQFWQTPNNHLSGQNCPKCSHKSNNYTTKEFIEKAISIHGDKYDYSKVEYINNKTKVCIICPIHGEFYQTPNSHLNGSSCNKCAIENNKFKQSKKLDTFISDAIKIHGNKYDYSKVEYINAKTKICIICPKHGNFWQTPHKHLNSKQGCPKCNSSKLETKIKNLLLNNNIKFEEQKTFKWLKNKKQLYLDFYLTDYNIAIECQGIQHFKPINKFGGEKFLEIQNERDKIKNNLCEKHGIKILYFSNIKIENTITNQNKLLNIIKNA